jgi:FkbM family methyltransferase
MDYKPELFCNGDIFDIGANIGYTSCLFSKALRAESKVYCFEPDQFNFDLLQEVIQRKKLSGMVVPVHAAVGASDGYIELWHNERHHGDHRVLTDHFKSTRPDLAGTCTVPMMTIDSYVRSHNLHNISFIKIDVQGYELAVCEGMKETLTAFPDTNVCFEYAPGALVELGFEPIRLLDFFTAKAYLIHTMSGRGIRLARDYGIIHHAAGVAGYIDLICSRRELV